MMQEFRAALVTGAAKRIGRALALRLAAEGYDVAVHSSARSRCEAEAVAEQIRAGGRKAVVVVAELANADAVAEVVSRAAAGLGPLSVLINNASLFQPDDARTMTAAGFDLHMAVNLRAPCVLAQAFAAQAPEAGGAVVNMIDQRVWRLNPTYFSYSLSKAALWSATQTLAQSLAPKIRVNGIGPGPTLANERQLDELFDAEKAHVLLQRGVELSEISDAMMFLINAPAVTGQMIAVDSGQHLAWETPDIMASEGRLPK